MIKVLIVDDSAVVRQQLQYVIQSDPGLCVVGEAMNGQDAIQMAKKLRPDVITMDIHMPQMDGMEAIRHIMAECPTPIVVLTNANLEKEQEIASRATKLGAVSVLNTPGRITGSNFQDLASKMVDNIKNMSQVKVISRPMRNSMESQPTAANQSNDTPVSISCSGQNIKLVAIGSSTGGPAALNTILSKLPGDLETPILIVQHISFGFVEGLASWLDGASRLTVKVAENGERIQPGVVYLAPDENHMTVDQFGRIHYVQTEPVKGHRPAATVLFNSVAAAFGASALGVILTGMGCDGALGLKALRDTGATTIAQDESSCVVFGMPKEAIALGAAKHIVPLDKIAWTIQSLCASSKRRMR